MWMRKFEFNSENYSNLRFKYEINLNKIACHNFTKPVLFSSNFKYLNFVYTYLSNNIPKKYSTIQHSFDGGRHKTIPFDKRTYKNDVFIKNHF